MKFLRWFLGFILFMLTILAWQGARTLPQHQVLQPKYERSNLEGRDFVYYTVQSGDSLSMLERKFRIPLRANFESFNPGVDPENLPLNHQIKIPLR